MLYFKSEIDMPSPLVYQEYFNIIKISLKTLECLCIDMKDTDQAARTEELAELFASLNQCELLKELTLLSVGNGGEVLRNISTLQPQLEILYLSKYEIAAPSWPFLYTYLSEKGGELITLVLGDERLGSNLQTLVGLCQDHLPKLKHIELEWRDDVGALSLKGIAKVAQVRTNLNIVIPLTNETNAYFVINARPPNLFLENN